MYRTMLMQELRGRTRQTIIIAAGFAIAIAMVIVVSALSSGVQRAQAQALESVYGVGTDLTVSGAAEGPGAGGPGGPRFEFGGSDGVTSDGTTTLNQSQLTAEMGRSTLDASVLQTITELDGVASAVGVLNLTSVTFEGELPDFSQAQAGGQAAPDGATGDQGGAARPGGPDGAGRSAFGIDSFSVLGVDPSDTELGPLSATEVTAGRGFTASDATARVALLDATYASTSELAVGDTVEIAGEEVEVIGIVASASDSADTAANLFLPLETARSLSGLGDVVSTVQVSATSSAAIADVEAALAEAVPDATVSSQSDLAAQVSGSLSSAASLLSSLGTWLSVIVLLVALLIAMLLTSSGVTRRTREFGTLKAIGWSNSRIMSQIAGESMVQALIGGAAGLVLGLGAAGIITLIAPTISTGSGAGDAPAGDPGAGGTTGMPDGAPEGLADGLAGGGMPGGLGRGLSAATEIVLTAPVTPWIVASAIGLTVLGGLLAGALGGWRTARLSPVEALRAVA